MVDYDGDCHYQGGVQCVCLASEFDARGRVAGRLRSLPTLLLLTLWLVFATRVTHAQAHSDRIERVEIVGADGTRPSTILDLLPRRAPASYSDAELGELQRRLSNLAVFDSVDVKREAGGTLRIVVREKWTLVPEVDVARGTTLADTYIFLGLTEYNMLGMGSAFGLSVSRERRGFGFRASYSEHLYRRDRWSLGAEVGYGSAVLQFPGDRSWYNDTAFVSLWTTSTPVVSDHLRYEVEAFYKGETMNDVTGDFRPPNGHTVGGSFAFTWDDYSWSDLTPSGWSANLTLSPAFFLGPVVPQGRHRVEFVALTACPVGYDAVLMARVEAGVVKRGNPNHNFMIGSVRGVRGLEDARYFNWIQAFANV
ncbi:MAG: hypothetical protein RL701_8025, partial [Pseudomonadota bacterium]